MISVIAESVNIFLNKQKMAMEYIPGVASRSITEL